MTDIRLCILTALPCEAGPVRRHLDLERDQGVRPFPLYRKGSRALVVTGVGKAAAYDITSRLVSMIDPRQACWVNLGIAGHPSRPVGQAVLINEILDEAASRRWRPAVPLNPPCDIDRLTTQSHPETRYRKATLYDMEAAGFYAAASRCADPGRIFCLKIVSDNRNRPAGGINARMVEDLITHRLGTLDQLLEQPELNP